MNDVFRMLHGEEVKPLVYRTLVPTVANLIISISPASLVQEINVSVSGWHPPQLIAPFFGSERLFYSPSQTPYDFLVVLSLMFASLLGYAAALHCLGRTLFPRSFFVAAAAPAIGLFVLPAFNTSFPRLKIYDFTQLMLTSWCLWCLATNRLKLYLCFFAIACVNKETTAFLTFFFAFWFRSRMETKRFHMLLTTQMVVFSVIKLTINFVFRHNPSPNWFLSDSQVVAFFEGFTLQAVINMALLVLLMAFRLGDKPLFLRQAQWLFLPQWLAYFFFCREGEYRNLFESLPIVVLIATHTLASLAGIDQSDVASETVASPTFPPDRRRP